MEKLPEGLKEKTEGVVTTKEVELPYYMDPSKLEDRSITKEPLEPLEGEEGRLMGLLDRVRVKLNVIRKAQKQAQWEKTPEGKRFTELQKSNEALQAQAAAHAEAVQTRINLEARRSRALEILADEYLKKHRDITDEDIRVSQIRYEQEQTRNAISGLSYQRGGR